MDVMFRRAIVLAVALGLTWMVFFGASYFGAVWTHYFSGDSSDNKGEVTVNVLPAKPQCPPGKVC